MPDDIAGKLTFLIPKYLPISKVFATQLAISFLFSFYEFSCQIGPTVWMMYLHCKWPWSPFVTVQHPVGTMPCCLVQRSLSFWTLVPPAFRIAPATPAPWNNWLFAAFVIASTFSFVMSLWTICILK